MNDDSLLDLHWRLPHAVHAAFTTRIGGVSAAPWDSFNLAAHVGDAPQAVAENRARLRRLLSLPGEPVWLNQVHGIEVADLDTVGSAASPLTADAATAASPGHVCAVMVADCLPVLFASRDGTRIAAAHAGWRGLAAGGLESTVRALGVDAAGLTAWVGPGISQQHFEVGKEVRDAFDTPAGVAADYFTPNARGRWQADLAGIARRRLEALGLHAVSGGQWCTFADRQRFFSHRRDGRGGRMAALIWRT